ncbi:hypothetical protein SB659_11855, partial [Arthrobacter sp. SIMBA_036]|uniref:hypothetical protein n=1 Tax=Arthrobacter sp. SIMBA_036 TaxID=3085778 RepID=UPI00397CEDBB
AIISTNQKTIGINKLGTLLSSQTTDPPKHNPHKHTTKAAHHNKGPLEKKSYFWPPTEPYTPSGFPFRTRRLRKQYTPHHTNANPPNNTTQNSRPSWRERGSAGV